MTLGSPWVADAVLVTVAAVAAYCGAHLLRGLVTGRRHGRDMDLTHIAMAAAMVGMLLGVRELGWTALWSVVFLAATAWFAAGAISQHRAAEGVPARPAMSHLLACVVMLYMVLVGWWSTAPSGVHGGPAMTMAPGGAPMIGAVLASLLVLDAAVSAIPLLRGPRGPQVAMAGSGGIPAAGTAASSRSAPGGPDALAMPADARGSAVCLVLMSLAMASMFVMR